ncbi:MAG: hypothetical protein HQL20_07635 [Candidatus Omnitrophica bacterium]|nr:hypothetical protein [Candidatus Omnitrophota bacterium]
MNYLSNTEFYAGMPLYARGYAIPVQHTSNGLIKYGRNGRVYQKVIQELVALKGELDAKVIIVYLNDKTDIVALKDGQPIMTSQGFADYDGIMSRTGCGAIDTSIVFQLFAAGNSSADIHRVLSKESGFKALTGESLSLAELIDSKDPRVNFALEIFSYQILKTIGAACALLEGLDTVVFTGDNCPILKKWTGNFISNLSFLGLQTAQDRDPNDPCLTMAGSKVYAYYINQPSFSL